MLRRDHASADRFPDDVLELQGYLADETRVPGVNAYPGRGTRVPLYILGSSLYGAQLAALLGQRDHRWKPTAQRDRRRRWVRTTREKCGEAA